MPIKDPDSCSSRSFETFEAEMEWEWPAIFLYLYLLLVIPVCATTEGRTGAVL